MTGIAKQDAVVDCLVDSGLEQIAAGPQEKTWPPHPLFGPLSWREWGVVTHRHVDHHLKQFGV